MKKLVLELTDAQFRRIATAAALLCAKPEHFVIGVTLGELDGESSDWEECEAFLDRITTTYGEERQAFDRDCGRSCPVEETAAPRRLKAAQAHAAASAGEQAETRVPGATISVPLTPADLQAFCADSASELYNDMTLTPEWKGLSEEDCQGVLKAWRHHSPNYVGNRLKYYERALASGYRGDCEDRRSLESAKEMHDETADRLERLLPYLERVAGPVSA